jgi:hypothetical protein
MTFVKPANVTLLGVRVAAGGACFSRHSGLAPESMGHAPDSGVRPTGIPSGRRNDSTLVAA